MRPLQLLLGALYSDAMNLFLPPASPALAPFVDALWYFEGEFSHALERMLPSGTMQLLVNLHEDELRSYHGEGYTQIVRTHGAQLSGAYASHFGIDTAEQRRIVGVSFRPGGAYPFFAVPAGAMFETDIPLDALWGCDGTVLRERLLNACTPLATLRVLESALLGHAVSPLETDPVIDFALAAFERNTPVKAVTAHLGMTPRRFITRFVDRVGLTPKRFACVRRFHRLLREVESGRDIDWAEAAVACGYFDQAHLIHDFRSFSGINPGAYRPRSDGEHNHVPIDASLEPTGALAPITADCEA